MMNNNNKPFIKVFIKAQRIMCSMTQYNQNYLIHYVLHLLTNVCLKNIFSHC